MFIIDSHQHFWTTSREDYGWLTAELGVIFRDFQPDDLQPLIEKVRIDKTILVQAAQTEAETLYLLDIASQTSFVAGVVGWVNFEAENAADRVAFMANKGVLGLRPMVQDIEETSWLLRPALRPAIQAMIAHNLCFDALVQPRHLKVLREFISAYPELKLIIDHGAKPDIASNAFQPWAKELALIADNSNIYCKLSGLVTEAASDWTLDDLRPYIAHLISCFGTDRLVWGSDWPVLNLASDYASWHALVSVFLKDMTHTERANIMGGNAARFYGIT
jgi:L-fuconolactonase